MFAEIDIWHFPLYFYFFILYDFDSYYLVSIYLFYSLENVVESINKNGVALKGVFSIPEFTPTNTGDLQNLNQKFRNSLDIYANVIQVKSLPGVQSKHKNVDFIVVREQTEGEYSALEHAPITGKLMILTCSWYQKKTNPRIHQFTNLKYCKRPPSLLQQQLVN